MKTRAIIIASALTMGAVAVDATPVEAQANCSKFDAAFRANGLPVKTFERIAYRESHCNPKSFVIDSDDAGGGLLGINLKGSLARTWRKWCGVTLATVTNASVNIRCAAVAYRKMGLRPWR